MAIVGFRHLGLKVVSVALAALLWLLVSGEQIVERALRIPLEFTNLPAQLELVGDAAERRRRARPRLVRRAEPRCRRASWWPCSTCGRRAPGRGCFT